MKPVSLADISYEQGLELLSLRKQALDSGEAKRLPSEVLRKSQMLQSIGEKAAAEGGFLANIASSFKNMDPGVKRTLLSGATGAGLGAIADNKNRLRNALMGGIAGGALGGGIGLATNRGVLDKAIDAAVPSAKDRAREALSGGKASPGSSAPGKLSDFGLNVSPERMAEIEANRLPNLANPLDNDLSQIEPYATGGGALAAGEYMRRKFAPTMLDPSEVSPALFKQLDGLDERTVSKAFKGMGLSPEELKSVLGAQSSDDLAKVLANTTLDKNKVIQIFKSLNPGSKTTPEIIKALRASAGKPMGYLQGAKSLARRVPIEGRSALIIPALLSAYGVGRVLGGGYDQAKNTIVWNKLKNRLEQVAE